MKKRVEPTDKKLSSKSLEKTFMDVCYNGERFLLQKKDGIAVAIVPVEDLEILEELEQVN